MDIKIYEATGKLYTHLKRNVWQGKNKFKLPIENRTLYLLNMQVKGINSIAFKQIKLIVD